MGSGAPSIAKTTRHAFGPTGSNDRVADACTKDVTNSADGPPGLWRTVFPTDPSQPEAQRVFSTYQLEQIGEIGALPGLIELSSSLEPGKLKTNVDLTVRSLENRQKHSGAKARMRPLTP